MAPEVIIGSENSGRAADIWSLGCVLIEMATGKRPWPELENKIQIMFKVGMGNLPKIPDNLSPEGQDFLAHCLQFTPDDRQTASQLKGHLFVAIHSEEDDEEGT